MLDEIKNKLIKYLNKKNINLEFDEYCLIWNYKIYDCEYFVELDFCKSDYSDDYIIKYYSRFHIPKLRRRKTTTKGNFHSAVYKNLSYIKSFLDKDAEFIKQDTDRKNKYCTELESYYKRLHEDVSITISFINYSSMYEIFVTGYDKDKISYYKIIIKDNKYYLITKTENFEKILN